MTHGKAALSWRRDGGEGMGGAGTEMQEGGRRGVTGRKWGAGREGRRKMKIYRKRRLRRRSNRKRKRSRRSEAF